MTKRYNGRDKIADENRKRVYEAMQAYPGASNTRLIGLTGLCQPTVLRAMRAVKAGWTPANMGDQGK